MLEILFSGPTHLRNSTLNLKKKKNPWKKPVDKILLSIQLHKKPDTWKCVVIRTFVYDSSMITILLNNSKKKPTNHEWKFLNPHNIWTWAPWVVKKKKT
jgi:hypothetical protein